MRALRLPALASAPLFLAAMTTPSLAPYQSHLKPPHFLKYKTATQSMGLSLKLLETDPILLGSK